MKKPLLFFVLILFSSLCRSQGFDSLDAFISKQVVDYKMPGIAIGIIKNHQVLFKKGYGVTSVVDKIPVTTQTVFPIMSCTKAFTAMAIGMLVDEGKMKWDDKVVQYLPDFKLSDPWITKQLTVIDILSHRSGLQSYEGDLLWYGTNYSRKEILQKIRWAPMRNNFRVDFGYQNVMYLLAGMLIEKVSGQSWDAFIKSRILMPLNMVSTSTSIVQMQKRDNYAYPHLENKPVELVNMDNIAPAGGINSNIDDLMKWVSLWLGEGRTGDQIILNNHSFEMITTLKTFTTDTDEKGYGLGWYIKRQEGRKVINHDGGMPGYKASIVWFPESGNGIVILTNKISPINDQLIEVLTEYLFRKDTMNWMLADQRMMRKGVVYSWDKPREDASTLKSGTPDLRKYVGEYEDSAYGKAIVSLRDGKPLLELIPTRKLFSGNIYYLDGDRFKIIFNDRFVPAGEILFEKNKANQIKGFRLAIETNDFHFGDLNFLRRK